MLGSGCHGERIKECYSRRRKNGVQVMRLERYYSVSDVCKIMFLSVR